jgi:hypothetical protein
MKASFAAIQVLFALHLTAQHNQQSPHQISLRWDGAGGIASRRTHGDKPF